MVFLDISEVNHYCSVPGVTEKEITIASRLIEVYIGKDLSLVTKEEIVTLNKKRKGKLKHTPIVSIDSVEGIFKNPFGNSSEQLETSSISVDSDYGYFEFHGNNKSMNCIVFSAYANQLKITYTSGYKTPPEDLKVACGALAGNIKKRGGLDNMNSWTTIDERIVLTDDSVFSTDIRMLCQRYRGV